MTIQKHLHSPVQTVCWKMLYMGYYICISITCVGHTVFLLLIFSIQMSALFLQDLNINDWLCELELF